MKKHATRRNHVVVISLVLLTFCTASFAGRIIYVKQGGTGDGSSWADANGILQQAINAASAGDQVWVEKGTYKPTVEVGGSGDRYKTFQMKNAVAIYGGFAGNEPNTFDVNDRNLATNETILSGDLLGNDTPGLDPCDLLNDPNRADNCYHIFYHPNTPALEPNAILDGITITAGNANAGNTYPHNVGSGMFNKNSSPTVTNCTFTGNSAGERGGGMYNSGSSSSPTVTNCTFTGNSAGGSGGWGDNGGGGMFNRNSSPTVTICTFTGNSAGYFGGGMYNSGSSSSPTVTNCTFTGNSADLGLGGGMFNNDSSPTVTNCNFTGNSAGGMFNYLNNSNPTVTNCTFTGNSADYEGGGMYNDGSHSLLYDGGGMYNDGNHPTVANCTFSGNTADWGGGMYNYYSSSPTLSNCILWDNTATSDGNEIYNDPDISHPANPLISYCDIAGSGGSTSWDPNLGSDANGNIDVDPYFVEPGNWDANDTPDDVNDDFWVEGDYYLLPDSPCIDAGDNNSVPADTIDLDNDGNTAEPIPWDLDENPRFVDQPDVPDTGNGTAPIVDMGAYEAMVSCFGVNRVKLETKAGKKGNKVELKGTFSPALPIDFARDDVIYIIDDGQGHMLSFIIHAGSFEPDGKPEKQKFKFDSPKHSQPDIKAKFDSLKCKFELKAKKVAGIDEITGTSINVVLYAGANIGQEMVELEVKGKKGEHLEYKRKPKFECCPKCKGIALLEVTSTGPFTGDEYVLVFEPDPGKEKLKRKTVVDDERACKD